MTTQISSLNWFEIAVTDIHKAAAFYGAVVGRPLRQEMFGGLPHAIFAAEDPGVAGALIQDPDRKAARGGTVIYLAIRDDVDQALARTREAGGKIVQSSTDLGPQGTCALIEDRDGNVVGLHAPKA